ncbi:hypothetical protein [[Eubacterium] hominis]|uniref:hypothetical protein n=1 Tax=[Eubacterium] hominis TaxID=2764325 RepID=UPI003A4E41D4
MLFTLKKEEQGFVIEESGHAIYRIAQDTTDKLLSFALKNPYGDEVMNFYQIKKWYQILPVLQTHEFSIYENDVKIGKLEKTKKGFDLILHDVPYHMYGGTHHAMRTVIVFDRETQVAEFTLGEQSSVAFTNGVFGSTYAMLLFLFQEIIKETEFMAEAFQDAYRGMYLRSLDDVVAE